MSVYLHFILKMYEWPQKVAFSWTQELRTQNANLPIYQQGQPCAQPFLLTPGSVCSSARFQTIFSSHDRNPHAQTPVPQAQVKCFQGPRSTFTVVWSASRLCSYAYSHATVLVVFCLLPFLVSLMKSGMSSFQHYSTQTSPVVLLHISTAHTISGWHHLCVHRTLFSLMNFLSYLMCNKW